MYIVCICMCIGVYIYVDRWVAVYLKLVSAYASYLHIHTYVCGLSARSSSIDAAFHTTKGHLRDSLMVSGMLVKGSTAI